MTNLFRNSSPGALALQQSVEQAKKHLVERGLKMRKARELAAQGRGGDTEVAHVAIGEIVLPKVLQTANVLSAIRQAAHDANISFDRLRIGSTSNSINPETGMPEFAGFDPDQPRVPAGHGQESGEWTNGAASEGSAVRNKPAASRQGQIVLIKRPDGTTEIRKGGSRAWRNNNPGNIGYGPFAKRHGAIGRDGSMAIFPDEATGEAASRALLNGPDYSSLTIDQAIAARTPDNVDGNDTKRTQRLVRQFSGLPGDAIIEHLSPDEKQRLYSAIRRSEGWSPGAVMHETP